MIQVIIIEDDPMVAAINRQYVESDSSFHVAGSFKNGCDALLWLADHKADLIILDYYTPEMSGLEFVDQLHRAGLSPPIVMVTSANDTNIVRGLLLRGILDYLVKPFEYARFRQAMDKFLQNRNLLELGTDSLDQQAIDRMMLRTELPETSSTHLAKGLNAATLKRIRCFLSDNRGRTFTGEQIADQVGLSRITIRRYVNHMVDIGEAVSSIDYQTGGRPSIQYRYTGQG